MRHRYDQPVVTATNVSKAFNGETVINDLSFEAQAGEVTLLTGLTGSGKSTLLSMLVGNLQPDTGSIKLFDTELRGASDKDIAVLKRDSRIGVGYQGHNLDRNHSVYNNLMDLPRALGQEVDRRQAAVILDRLGITPDQLPKKAKHLSGGQKLRVAVARLMLCRPRALFLDEPTAGLDPDGKTAAMTHIAETCHATGTTAIIATHEPQFSMAAADRIVVLRAGAIDRDIQAPFDNFSLAQELA